MELSPIKLVTTKARLIAEKNIVEEVALSDLKTIKLYRTLFPGMMQKRQEAVEHVFRHIQVSPPKEIWIPDGVNSEILTRLCIPSGSYKDVKKPKSC